MVDNENVIDFSKKKKKKQINLTDLLEPETEANKDVNVSTPDAQSTNDNDELDLSSLKKKKKKKKTGFSLDGEQSNKENGATQAGATEEELELPLKKKSSKTSHLEDATGDAIDEDLDDLGLGKKKKKSKRPLEDKKVSFFEPGEEPETETIILGDNTWGGTDRDYTYDELVTRVFDIMRQKNPEMIAGEKKRFIMKPPQCARVGTKKTSFVNFTDICQMLHRQPKHILAFILAELGTSGSVDGNNQLIIKGRFQQKQLESVLRRYIKEYVTCHTCKSPDTLLERDVRLYFLRCRVCQSRCSVATIKSGFQAVTNKRARMRAKANS